MSLSIAEQNRLNQEYGQLINLLPEGMHGDWLSLKQKIVDFCIEQNLPLYNIVQLKTQDASRLLNHLVSLFSTANNDSLNQEKLVWRDEFNRKLVEHDRDLVEIHGQAYLNVGAQYEARGAVLPETLLSLQDLKDLLDAPGFQSATTVLVNPISLTEYSADQFQHLHSLLSQTEPAKNIFIPTHHQGHWFYLLQQDGQWSVCDSQPLINGAFTQRQKSIMADSHALLSLLGEDKEAILNFSTTAKQHNDYDCGTQVVNAYRTLVDPSYIEKDHQSMLNDLLEMQLPEMILSMPSTDFTVEEDTVRILTEKEMEIIERTISAQADPLKTALYKDTIKTLMNVVATQGLFAGIQNKISIDAIDSVQANEHETDEEFATRLQEAEFRKAGL